MLTHPLAFVGFAQARMLSPEGLCRAYDSGGKGYVRAEGGAVVVLQFFRPRRSYSTVTVLARLRGWSMCSPRNLAMW